VPSVSDKKNSTNLVHLKGEYKSRSTQKEEISIQQKNDLTRGGGSSIWEKKKRTTRIPAEGKREKKGRRLRKKFAQERTPIVKKKVRSIHLVKGKREKAVFHRPGDPKVVGFGRVQERLPREQRASSRKEAPPIIRKKRRHTVAGNVAVRKGGGEEKLSKKAATNEKKKTFFRRRGCRREQGKLNTSTSKKTETLYRQWELLRRAGNVSRALHHQGSGR